MVYCRECGHKHSDRAKACPKCGYQECYISKSIVIYLILCWFFGVLGAHRFYAHKIVSAIVMLVLTCVFLCGVAYAYKAGSAVTMSVSIYVFFGVLIWTLIDFIIGLCNIPHPENIFDNK